MNAADILALIERLERDLAALKAAVRPPDDAAEDELRALVAERAARMRAARGGGR